MLGVSWGRTLTEVAERLPDGWARGVTVVQINGGVSLNRRPGTAATLAVDDRPARQRARSCCCRAPPSSSGSSTKQAIESDRTVADVLERAVAAYAYLYSAGVADENSALVDSGYLRADDVAELARKGAVGDVVGRYIDANGNIVAPALDERTVGICPRPAARGGDGDLRRRGGGEARHRAGGRDRAGCARVLVTDEATARALLEET